MTAVMRRADDRRSASVMIRSSIRWSLAGNDVDWIMNASEPRTFSRISTKISLSAKRRTLALVSGRCSQLAISWASTGLELPATSLIEPFLAAIDASPRALLDTTFSISRNPRNRRVSMGEEISGRGLGWQPVDPVFPVKKRRISDFYGGAYWALSPSAATAGASCTGIALSTLATAGPRRSGAGAGAASGVPLIV